MRTKQAERGEAKHIFWHIPREYRDYERRRKRKEIWDGFRSPKGVLGVIATLGFIIAFAAFLYDRGVEKTIAGAVTAILGGIISHSLGGLLFSQAQRYAMVHEKGVMDISWNKLAWYQFRDVPEFPHLRALEAAQEQASNTKSRLLPFDPKVVDEAALAAFLDRMAPGKRWQH